MMLCPSQRAPRWRTFVGRVETLSEVRHFGRLHLAKGLDWFDEARLEALAQDFLGPRHLVQDVAESPQDRRELPEPSAASLPHLFSELDRRLNGYDETFVVSSHFFGHAAQK